MGQEEALGGEGVGGDSGHVLPALVLSASLTGPIVSRPCEDVQGICIMDGTQQAQSLKLGPFLLCSYSRVFSLAVYGNSLGSPSPEQCPP